MDQLRSAATPFFPGNRSTCTTPILFSIDIIIIILLTILMNIVIANDKNHDEQRGKHPDELSLYYQRLEILCPSGPDSYLVALRVHKNLTMERIKDHDHDQDDLDHGDPNHNDVDHNDLHHGNPHHGDLNSGDLNCEKRTNGQGQIHCHHDMVQLG